VLYDALKKEFPEFLDEVDKKVSLEIRFKLDKMLSRFRAFNTNFSTPILQEKIQRLPERRPSSLMARMFWTRIRSKKPGRR
jgi:hypothetical protein